MLKNIINEKLIRCHGVVAFYKANSVGDDILLYNEDDTHVETLYGLRQQVSGVNRLVGSTSRWGQQVGEVNMSVRSTGQQVSGGNRSVTATGQWRQQVNRSVTSDPGHTAGMILLALLGVTN